MANNIHELDEARIETNPDGTIKDLNIAIFKDDTMNFTSFNNLPIYNKFQINLKVDAFEKQMTTKMQEHNIIGKIYRDKDGTLVEDNLKIDEISDKLKNRIETEPEIGIRYEFSVKSGEAQKINSTVKRCIKNGPNIVWYDVNDSTKGPIFSADNYDLGTDTYTKNENYFSKYHPWSSMKKMQIADDGYTKNYDLSIDNGGSYYTEVELYYIKNKFLLESYDSTTGIYTPLYDLTSVWDNANVRNCIPNNLLTLIDANPTIYSVGMYEWVSKYPYVDYRPASFFIKHQGLSADPTLVPSPTTFDNLYVRLDINGVEYYQKYKNFVESDLYDSTITPKLYSLSLKEDELTKVVKVLERKHWFGCYEGVTQTRSSDSKTILVSKPNLQPRVSTTMVNFRTYAKNLRNNMSSHIRDMRTHQDFFGVLMDIEFGTLDSQAKMNGYSGGLYSADVKLYFDQTNSDIAILPFLNVVKSGSSTTYGAKTFIPNQVVAMAASQGVSNARKILDIHILEEFSVEKSGGNIVRYSYDGTNYTEDPDGEYCKITLTYNQTTPYYVHYIETTADLPTSFTDITNNKEKDICYCNDDGYLYSPNTNPSNGLMYALKLSDTVASIPHTYCIHNIANMTGQTDIASTSRTCTLNSNYFGVNNTTKTSFKWNWIENPYGNIWKFIDGIKIKHNVVPGVSAVHNGIYYCNKPYYFSSTEAVTDGYELITKYPMPGSGSYIKTLGFDSKNPEVQLTVSTHTTYINYRDYYYQNASSGSTAFRCLLAGGYWCNGTVDGLRCFYVSASLSGSTVNFGASSELSEG